MASLLMAATSVGCFIFTIYASGLFFRSKAREYGVFMALGIQKKELKKLLFGELSMVTALSCLVGLVLSVPLSWVIWKIFEIFIISNEQMDLPVRPCGIPSRDPVQLYSCPGSGRRRFPFRPPHRYYGSPSYAAENRNGTRNSRLDFWSGRRLNCSWDPPGKRSASV